MIRELITRLRRALDLEAPADGLCTWRYETVMRVENVEGMHEYREIFRCRETWHHEGGHFAPRTDRIRS